MNIKSVLMLITFMLVLVISQGKAYAVLTSGNVTIKLSGGTYSSWVAFWDDVGNLTGDITCTVDASAFTEDTAPAAITESLNNHTLHVLPVSFPTKTDASDGARFTCNYTEDIWKLSMAGDGTVIIEGMVLIGGIAKPFTGLYIINNSEFNFIYRRNIIKDTSFGVFYYDDILNGNTKIYNNIIYGIQNHAFKINYDIPLALIANNTIVSSDAVGFDTGGEELTLKNNLSYGGSESFSLITLLANGYNNASSDATAEDGNWGGTGSGNLTNIADPFNDLANDDFTITAEGVIGTAGLDLSGDFTDDFFGVTRSNWTIGACELASAGWAGKLMGITSPAKVMGVEPTKVNGI